MTNDEFYQKWLEVSLKFYEKNKTGYWKQVIEEQALKQFNKEITLEEPNEQLDF